MGRWVAVLLVTWPLLTKAQPPLNGIGFFQVAAVKNHPCDSDRVALVYEDHGGAIGRDTLFVRVSPFGEPVSYYRDVSADICADGVCKPLRIVLHWNITGRYLGFTLPPGEYLSKADHKPFLDEDYERLHRILSDPSSMLRGYRFSDLVHGSALAGELDGITRATAADVRSHVVDGAVYTTYVIWHLVHGQTSEDVMRLTVDRLTERLVFGLLESPDISDREWALNRIPGRIDLTAALGGRLLEIASGTSFSLAERAMNAISTEVLAEEWTQRRLIAILVAGDYSRRRLILDRLALAPGLNNGTVAVLNEQLALSDGDTIAAILRLFAKFDVRDGATLERIHRLRRNPNRYIAHLAEKYLNVHD